MPTNQLVAGAGTTDLGWGFAEVETVDGERVAIVVTCKACKASTRYDTRAGGGIVNGFAHIEPCRVLDEVKRAARAGLARAGAKGAES